MVIACDGCGRADREIRRLMVVTHSGVSWTWRLCLGGCYERTLGNVREALDRAPVPQVVDSPRKERRAPVKAPSAR